MAINVVFNPPLPSDDPATFNSKAFSTLGDLNAWSQQANALATEVSQDEAALSSAVSSASASAATATTKAGEAATSATNAAASSSSAGASATTATTKAGEAATSATNAAASAATAGNAAATATAKASEANTSAVNAASSATTASGAATTATTKASEAAASAMNATASATTATTKAGEASASALAAAEAAQDAIDAAASISGGPVTSVNGQTGVVVLDAADFGLGSAAQLNAPATGDAAAGEVVKGSDTRLKDARTPTAHTHVIEGVSGLQTALNGKENTGTAAAAVAAHEASGDPHPQYQVDLVSGTNIKTINGQSILGAGNIEIQGGGGVGVTLSGDTNIYVTQSKTYTITNYNVFSSYVVQVSAGSVSISGGQITFTAPAAAQTVTLTVNMDSVATEFSLVVQAAAVSAPTITAPSAGATGIGQAPTISTAAFTTIGISDTQLNSDWEVRTATNGDGTLIASSLADATNKTSWTVPGNLLSTATTYYARVRHRGTALGDGPWSEISFTTAATFGGLIGTQGGQGFGVGVCPNASILTARGLSAMTGTTDKTHANYGNYQHSNGSIVCYVPKFFYRIGHASSPRYATYGANAHDVVDIDTFANEAAANAAGYALHRAFVNAGVEVDGFFMDKYLASKDGTSSCKSVANATPISLTTSTSYTNSNGMTGCTGILADAVVLSRARGAGWNCAAAYHYDAVALLSLAHGQASTSSTYCAWYDAAGTTNFPKGCNNGALADTNDASVTYATAGDTGTSAKPKTRATANFAKTTHNGQECGIADINGSMWQALIGLTMAGTSATDTTQNTTGTAYVLKRSADFGALTGGFGGANDAWGTTSSLATLFDAITGFEPWTSTTGWTYYGNGANAVFSNATSGTDYQRRCNGIPILAGCSASGTNQFGNDGCYQYGRANQVPLAAGDWTDAAVAGAFSRYWSNSRSGGYSSFGFRCAAY